MELLAIEEAPEQCMGAARDRHAAIAGYRGPQSEGEIERLAEPLLRCVHAADQHGARRDSHAGTQPCRWRDPGSPQRAHQLEPRADGSLGIVLARFRISEIDEQRVAWDSHHGAAEPLHDLRCQLMKADRRRTYVFRIILGVAWRKSAEFARHNRQGASFKERTA